MDLDVEMDVDVDLVPDEPIAPELAFEEIAVGISLPRTYLVSLFRGTH